MREFAIGAQFAIDGDRAAFVRIRTAPWPLDNDTLGLIAAYAKAVLTGDFSAADRALSNPHPDGVRVNSPQISG